MRGSGRWFDHEHFQWLDNPLLCSSANGAIVEYDCKMPLPSPAVMAVVRPPRYAVKSNERQMCLLLA
jgi:hypothetical protein